MFHTDDIDFNVALELEKDNPYLLELVKRFGTPYAYRQFDRSNFSDTRREFVSRYSWAIPNHATLETIKREASAGVVEIGAGTGYWAHLLRLREVDVVAYDLKPHVNHWCKGNWSPVLAGEPVDASKHPERALLLCWAPYDDSMAADALTAYSGDTLLWVGEGRGGCTGDDKFWELIDRGWREMYEVEIPQWEGIHDSLTVYKRIAATGYRR